MDEIKAMENDVVVSNEISNNEKKKCSVKGNAILGFVFTISIILSILGFLLSFIAVIRGICKKSKNKRTRVKGFALAIISLILSVLLLATISVFTFMYWEDVEPVALNLIEATLDESGLYDKINEIEDIIPIDISIGQMDTCLKISKLIESNEISKAANFSANLEEPLTETEKSIIMDSLTEKINNRIYYINTSFCRNNIVVSDEIMKEVSYYSKIVKNTGITRADDTNIKDYLLKVSSLETYEKYNDLFEYQDLIMSDLESANYYWESACDSYSYYVKVGLLEKAYNHFSDCLTTSYRYSIQSFGIIESQEFYQQCLDKINYYFTTGRDMTIDQTLVNNYSNAVNQMLNAIEDLVEEMGKLPTSVYYH